MMASCVFEPSYGKILLAYYDGCGAPEGSFNLTIVIWHYLSVAELDIALVEPEASVCIDSGATTGTWYWESVAEGA